MAYSQKELARRFANGADSGTASNLSIVTDGEDSETTHLVGYGWAVYATHHPNGKITIYEDGWREWATERGGKATHGQLSALKAGVREVFGGVRPEDHALAEFAEDTPTVASPPDSVNLVGDRVMTR